MTSLCYKCFTPLALKYKIQKNKNQHTTSTGIPRPPWGNASRMFSHVFYMDEIFCMTVFFIKRTFN